MTRGPQPKHPDKRQRRNKPPAPALVVVADPQIPPPPIDLKVPDVTLPAWDEYWSGSMAKRIDIGDLPALYRLFRLRDEWEYNQALLFANDPLIEGSKGQLVENPLSRINSRLAKEIRQMEDRFGMNPVARAQFAVAMGDLARTMDDLAKGVKRKDDDDSDPLQIVDVSDTAE